MHKVLICDICGKECSTNIPFTSYTMNLSYVTCSRSCHNKARTRSMEMLRSKKFRELSRESKLLKGFVFTYKDSRGPADDERYYREKHRR